MNFLVTTRQITAIFEKHFSPTLTIVKYNNLNAGEIIAEHNTYIPGGMVNLFNHVGKQGGSGTSGATGIYIKFYSLCLDRKFHLKTMFKEKHWTDKAISSFENWCESCFFILTPPPKYSSFLLSFLPSLLFFSLLQRTFAKWQTLKEPTARKKLTNYPSGFKDSD